MNNNYNINPEKLNDIKELLDKTKAEDISFHVDWNFIFIVILILLILIAFSIIILNNEDVLHSMVLRIKRP